MLMTDASFVPLGCSKYIPVHIPLKYTACTCSQMYRFSTFRSRSLPYVFRYFIDILRTSSSINPSLPHIHVYICMYVCTYHIIVIKLHCLPVTQFYWYSTVICVYWGAVLFFIPSTNLFVFINQLTFPFPPFCTLCV